MRKKIPHHLIPIIWTPFDAEKSNIRKIIQKIDFTEVQIALETEKFEIFLSISPDWKITQESQWEYQLIQHFKNNNDLIFYKFIIRCNLCFIPVSGQGCVGFVVGDWFDQLVSNNLGRGICPSWGCGHLNIRSGSGDFAFDFFTLSFEFTFWSDISLVHSFLKLSNHQLTQLKFPDGPKTGM